MLKYISTYAIFPYFEPFMSDRYLLTQEKSNLILPLKTQLDQRKNKTLFFILKVMNKQFMAKGCDSLKQPLLSESIILLKPFSTDRKTFKATQQIIICLNQLNVDWKFERLSVTL